VRTRLGYLPALDGLRGVAIALVVAYHYAVFPFGGGDGVDLFFVLSGFLITTLLLEELSETGAISLSTFYARRARRLLPALLTMLAAFSIIAVGKGHNPVWDLERFGFYTGNAVRAFVLLPPSGLGHLWSLAEEEQFYLVWPLLLLAFARTRRLLVFTLALTAALIVYRAGLAISGASLNRLYFGPDTHADGLTMGAALGIIRQRRSLAVPDGWLPWIVGSFTLAVLLPNLNTGWHIIGLPLFEIVCVALIAAVVTGSPLTRPLSWPPLVFLGKISYSLYLWHFMLLWAFGWRYELIALPLALLCAWISYRFVEQPFRRRRVRSASDPIEPVTEPVGAPVVA
jgi:peptidoglycan/LPS O-acetylase OafA/YrhL